MSRTTFAYIVIPPQEGADFWNLDPDLELKTFKKWNLHTLIKILVKNDDVWYPTCAYLQKQGMN